jgi:hypothetical protein
LLTGIVRQQCKVCPELELREKGQEPILSDWDMQVETQITY